MTEKTIYTYDSANFMKMSLIAFDMWPKVDFVFAFGGHVTLLCLAEQCGTKDEPITEPINRRNSSTRTLVTKPFLGPPEVCQKQSIKEK